MLSRTARWWPTIGGSVITMALLWWTEIPLGIPAEWAWPRLPADEQTGWNLVLAGFGAAAYVGVVACGGWRLAQERVTTIEIAGWLAVLCGISAAWLWTVQETAPPAAQWAKAPFVLYYPSSSGYFYHVRYRAPDPQAFLSGYERMMAEGDVLHVGTHPPGLFLLFHGLIGFQTAFPGVTDWLAQWQPESFREAMAIVRENSAQTPTPADVRDGVTLWLATLVALACAAGTVAPLYRLLRWNLPREAAWYGASLWPAVPAVAIFLPKSDAAYPLISAGLVAVALSAWRRRSLAGAFVAGVILWVGLMASLAFLPVVLFVGLFVVTDRWSTRGMKWPDGTETAWLTAGAAGFLVPIGLLGWLSGVNLPIVWLWNYRNHAGFYEQFSRTWWEWLLINPVELMLAVGVPIAALALSAAISLCTARCGPPASTQRAAWLGLGVWGVLWLSGKNSGEAARLWLLLMPGLVWLAGQSLVRRDTGGPSSRLDVRYAIGSLVLALIVGVLTVHRVGGFHLAAG